MKQYPGSGPVWACSIFVFLTCAVGCARRVVGSRQAGPAWAGVDPFYRWGNALGDTAPWAHRQPVPRVPARLSLVPAATPCRRWPLRPGEQLSAGPLASEHTLVLVFRRCGPAACPHGGGRERALGRAWAAARGGGEAVEAAPTARVALEETESWFKQLSHRHVARKPQHRIPQTPCGPVGNCSPPPAQRL